MIQRQVLANQSFIENGEFPENLDGWEISNSQLVTRQSGMWENQLVGFMGAVNQGSASQTISLAPLPRPTIGRAEYKLIFHYEATQGAECTLRVAPGMGGEVELKLVPSRLSQPVVDGEGVLLDLYLVEYPYALALDCEETSVTFTFITPPNASPGMGRGLRVAFVRVELMLEPLRLAHVTIDGETQSPDQPLHLCFGATHNVALTPVADSLWVGTQAGLLVEGGTADPQNILSAAPPWGQERSLIEPWSIYCAWVVEDREIRHRLAVRSQYTALDYPLAAISGHFQLDVIALQSAIYYPVIDLGQNVELQVRVESHYTQTRMADRQVTWTLKGANPADDRELCKTSTDGNGEATLVYTPELEGKWQIVASVDSHYKKEDACHAFEVTALQQDPWLGAAFGLDAPDVESPWGADIAYPCRGASHEISVKFAPGHALAETDLALLWLGEDTAAGLGIVVHPALESWSPIAGQGMTWSMACENRRDSSIILSISCSKLLLPAPLQTLKLAHNWLAVGEVRQPSRFPSVGGAVLPLEVQILSRVPGVGSVSNIDVEWSLNGAPGRILPSGDDGRSEYPFEPVQEGDFTVSARAASPYRGPEVKHEFAIKVLAEDPWSSLVTVTLDGRGEGPTGLLCFRDAEAVELRIMPLDDILLNEDIYLDLLSETGDLAFDFDPPLAEKRQMTAEGLVWSVRSSATTSARFQLHVCHDELDTYTLQGRLLAKTLAEEGTFTLDDQAQPDGATWYPCLGGQHTLRFTPKPGSLLTGLEVAASWVNPPSVSPHVKLEPEAGAARELGSAGLSWTLDCRDSTESAALGLALSLTQASFVYPALDLALGHNRMIINESDVRGPTYDPVLGEQVVMEIHPRSYYTGLSVDRFAVDFQEGEVSTPVPSAGNGWARFTYAAVKPGDIKIIATVPSPYDGTGNSPTVEFSFTVLAVGILAPGSGAVAARTLEETSGMDDDPVGHYRIEIGEVHEAAFDPAVGESVWLGLNIRSTGTLRAAAGTEVLFTVEEQPVRVLTDGDGWAYFAYTAEEVKRVDVVATLQGVGNDALSTVTHSFSVQSVAAVPWDDARVQLNDEPVTVWGAQTRFPRITQVHMIKLSVDNSNSHLLGREISLGLKGYIASNELGLNTIRPALGQARTFTTEGLSWTVSGSRGGAFALQLEASRLLRLSPLNAMSMGSSLPIPNLANCAQITQEN